MKNKDYIKKGQEYLKGLKEYAYVSFILEMILIIVLIALYISKK